MKTPASPATATNTATCKWFLDVSNIHWSAVQLAQERETALAARSLRLHFDNLYSLLAGGRPETEGRAVGTMPAPVAAQMRRPNVEVTSLEPGAVSGREQGVDETLQVAIYQTAASERTGVATVATGDGAGHHKARGFLPCIQQLRRVGWTVEVIAWAATCNSALRRFAEQEGQFIALEDYYSSITFTGTRSARPLSLVHRRRGEVAR